VSVAHFIGLDESFGHQLVAPRSRTLYDDERWAERAYYLLHLGDLTLNAGRQLYSNAGVWRIFAADARRWSTAKADGYPVGVSRSRESGSGRATYF
jgi:hypothetical protein